MTYITLSQSEGRKHFLNTSPTRPWISLGLMVSIFSKVCKWKTRFNYWGLQHAWTINKSCLISQWSSSYLVCLSKTQLTHSFIFCSPFQGHGGRLMYNLNHSLSPDRTVWQITIGSPFTNYLHFKCLNILISKLACLRTIEWQWRTSRKPAQEENIQSPYRKIINYY